MVSELSKGLGGKKWICILLPEGFWNDKVDINELKKALNSEQRLRTEVEMLYGHAQINSHFFLDF